LPPGSVLTDAQRVKESPGHARGFQGWVIQPSRDQGALDAPILSERTNQARRGAGPPLGVVTQTASTQATQRKKK